MESNEGPMSEAQPEGGEESAGAGEPAAWDRIDIDQARREPGALTDRVRQLRVLPLAGGLAGLATLGAVGAALGRRRSGSRTRKPARRRKK